MYSAIRELKNIIGNFINSALGCDWTHASNLSPIKVRSNDTREQYRIPKRRWYV